MLVFPLNHYAWVHVQYTQHGESTHHTPRTQPRHQPSTAGEQYPSSLPVSCSYSIQSYISTRRSESLCRHTQTAPLARYRIVITKTITNREEWITNKQTNFPNNPISSKSPRFQAFLQYISRTLKGKTIQKQWTPISPPKKMFQQISLHLNNFLDRAENNILLRKIFSIQRQHSIRKINSGMCAPLWIALARRMQVYQNPSWGTLKCVKIWSV